MDKKSIDKYKVDKNKEEPTSSRIHSLRDLIDTVTGRNLSDISSSGESVFSEMWPFPFLALVKQKEMKLGLLLALINPSLGGVLLIGPRGTGKTTAVRGLINLLPSVLSSTCYYGCIEEDVEFGGMDAVCPDCAEKFGHGKSLTSARPIKLVELPLNAELDDVLGKIDERAAVYKRMQVRRGILSHANKNILFIDEVNLLEDRVVDAILDASALGSFTVRRGTIAATYQSRFTLIGTMNPEEGSLRPQIMDRFGLRLLVTGLEDIEDRLEAYNRSQAYIKNPLKMASLWENDTNLAKDEIENARALLPKVKLPEAVAKVGLKLIRDFKISSIRAELTLFEASKALAAADNREEVSITDILQIAPMTLRLRRSKFIKQYFVDQSLEEDEIRKVIDKIGKAE